MAQTRPGDIFQTGELLNNTYRIEELLGRGGTSEVYKAKSEISGRIVALKALRAEFSSNDDYLALMTREEDIRDIRHDAIVRYFDTQRRPDGTVYLVMDYVEGPDLDAKLRQGGLPANDLMVIGARVCEGLVAAHDRNIVHRDLSPDNIILRDDDPAQAVIIDFGIAKDTNPGAETIVGNEFAGKYAFAAPEQLSGQTDARSDIYALGALLLASFRGKKPDIGSNPMEVVERKGQPLDISGVPEPLAGLIAKMTDPDPSARFQTASAVLDAFRNGGAVATQKPALDEATVIAPSAKPQPKPRAQSRKADKKRGGFLVPVVVVLALGAAGAGAFFSGALDSFLGPSYPPADPFRLVLSKPEGGAPVADGVAPSTEFAETIRSDLVAAGGRADLLLASGDIPDNWGETVLALHAQLDPLESYTAEISGAEVSITGRTDDAELASQIEQQIMPLLTAPYSGEVAITFQPPILAADDIRAMLGSYEDCGALTLVAPPELGYGLNDGITVRGKLADTSSRIALFDAISAMAGNRPVALDAEVLSPTLCQIEAALPDAPSAGMELRLGFGDRPDDNVTGRYFVNENPVIDVELPNEVADGFLYVSVIDVSGNVFHLLPNVNRTSHGVADLRAENGETIRVAYGLEEAQGTNKLAFLVDDSVLGKSRVVAIWASRELFGGMRPTTESVEGYADALQKARNAADLSILGLDSRILETAQP